MIAENTKQIIEEKLIAKLDIHTLPDGEWLQQENVVITSSEGENYDIAFANNYVVNAQKVLTLTWQNCIKKEQATKHLTQLIGTL